MSELLARFERQAAWQRARAQLSWTEKLRLAAHLRDLAASMQRSRSRPAPAHTVAETPAKYDGHEA